MSRPGTRRASLLTAATALWALVVVAAASDGAVGLVDLALYAFGGAAVALSLARAAILALVRRRPGAAAERGAGPPWRRLAQGLCLAAAVLGVSFDLAFQARFAASRAALEEAAREIPSGTQLAGPYWIALLRVREIDAPAASVRFVTGGCGMVDDCGVVYSPGKPPPLVARDSYAPLGGPWWRWRRSW
jgi:hypothetical protein